MTEQRTVALVATLLAIVAGAAWWQVVHAPAVARHAALRAEISSLRAQQLELRAVAEEARRMQPALQLGHAAAVTALWERVLSELEAQGLRIVEATFAEAPAPAGAPAAPPQPGPPGGGPGMPGAPSGAQPPGPGGPGPQPPGGEAMLRRFTARIVAAGSYVQVAPATRAASAAVPGLWWTAVRMTGDRADGMVEATLTAILVTSVHPIPVQGGGP
jgi:hypothetical protein